MRSSLTLKQKRKTMDETAIKKAKQDIEFSLADVDRVVWAVFDYENLRVEIEYDDESDEYDFSELIRTVNENGNFIVLSTTG